MDPDGIVGRHGIGKDGHSYVAVTQPFQQVEGPRQHDQVGGGGEHLPAGATGQVGQLPPAFAEGIVTVQLRVLARPVVDQPRRAPVEIRRLQPPKAVGGGREAGVETRGEVLGLGGILVQPLVVGRAFRRGDGEVDHRLQGDHPGIVPVLIETAGDGRHHGTHSQDIEIAEIELAVQVVVLIGDVAAAEDGHAAVDDEGLVVHAPIEARKVAPGPDEARQLAQGIQPQDTGRVVQTDLDLGMVVEPGQKTGVGIEGDLVDDDPDPDPPLRRPQQALGGDLADVVLIPDKVLGIDGVAGLIGQHAPPQKGLLALVQEQETRLASGLVADQALEPLAQGGAAGIGDGLGFGPVHLLAGGGIDGLEASAAGQHQRRQRQG